jgi:hypothetical protein
VVIAAGPEGGTGGGRDPDDARALALAALALARRCAAGATIWCVAPGWPSHARHVAVEFVHPVIVGKRALPARTVEGPGLVEKLRLLCRRGDVLVAVSGPDPAVADAVRRAGAWGVTTVWIGAGERPPAGSADHVLWCEEDEAAAAYGGRLVLRYHLLWELAHVCFEHPGLVAAGSADQDECEGPVCTTCADEGRLGEVVSLAPHSLAKVRTPAGVEDVDTSLVEGVRPGDLVLVHAGTAISVVGERPGASR